MIKAGARTGKNKNTLALLFWKCPQAHQEARGARPHRAGGPGAGTKRSGPGSSSAAHGQALRKALRPSVHCRVRLATSSLSVRKDLEVPPRLLLSHPWVGFGRLVLFRDTRPYNNPNKGTASPDVSIFEPGTPLPFPTLRLQRLCRPYTCPHGTGPFEPYPVASASRAVCLCTLCTQANVARNPCAVRVTFPHTSQLVWVFLKVDWVFSCAIC